MGLPIEHVMIKHRDDVLRFCSGWVGPEQAKDIWSETQMAALKNKDRFELDWNAKSWLLATARNKAVDWLRRESRRRELERLATACHWERSDRIQCSWMAFEQLTDRQRQAVILRYLSQLTYAEVAVLLGGNETSARRAVCDGLRKLRQVLLPPNVVGE